MSTDLAQVETLAGALLRKLSASDRRRILRIMARDLQTSQSQRIARQQAPDGSVFERRRPQKPARPGNFAVKFLYPKGSPTARLVLMKSWVHQGPLLTGYDVEAGAVRSFFWDKVDRWLPVDPHEQNKGAGRFRRNGQIRRAAMFRKLRNRRNLRADATDREAWVGFAGRAAEIAGVSQDGLMDRPAAGAKPVRYARRVLLGASVAESNRLLDLMLSHLSD